MRTPLTILFFLFLVSLNPLQSQDSYSRSTKEVLNAFSFTTIRALPGHLKRHHYKKTCKEALHGIDGFKARYMLGRYYAAQRMDSTFFFLERSKDYGFNQNISYYLLCSYYVRVLDWLVTGGPCDGTPVPESGLLTDYSRS